MKESIIVVLLIILGNSDAFKAVPLMLMRACGKNVHNSRVIYKKGSYGGRLGPPRPPNIGNSHLFMSDASPENETVSSEVTNGESDVEESNNFLLEKWAGLSKDTQDDIKTTAFSFIFALCVRLFLFEPRYIPSLSMYPTFDIGDQLLVDKISVKINRPYTRRDVVIFNPAQAYIDLTGNTEALIKRIVAVGGDTVEVKGNHLYVNGELQVENYVNELPDYR
jgi:signal peptidase I